jgi:predicted CXXCH cytochrome family protein
MDPNYYKTRDAQSRWRALLTVGVLLIFALGFAIAPIPGRGRDPHVRFFQHASLASKGPLAHPHAEWEANCQACHLPRTPVASRAGDAQCQTCHAGTIHHASQRAQDVPACAECHRDHRGSDTSLLAMDDSVCTSCHRDLPRHRKPDAGTMLTAEAESVTRFSANKAEHPAFTAPAGVPGPDSGRIKFSHALHIARGLTLEPEGKPWIFAALKNEADRVRYGWTHGHDTDPIQLRCRSCHRLDPGDAAGASGTVGGSAGPRPAGDAMLPVTYENDCRACHPLAFDPKDPERMVPHGLKPQQVIEQLKQFYTSQAVKDDPALLRRFIPPRPMPGRPASPEAARAEKAATDKTLAALRRLFAAAVEERVRVAQQLRLGRGGCVECHELTPASRPLVSLEAASSLDIKPVVVRSLWYQSASFNHATHRALKCRSCHAGASESKDQNSLLLPNVGPCVSCHAPATTQGGRPRGGAGTSCAECHRYHNGDHPAQGIGAAARRATARMTIDQFLSGGPQHRS